MVRCRDKTKIKLIKRTSPRQNKTKILIKCALPRRNEKYPNKVYPAETKLKKKILIKCALPKQEKNNNNVCAAETKRKKINKACAVETNGK